MTVSVKWSQFNRHFRVFVSGVEVGRVWKHRRRWWTPFSGPHGSKADAVAAAIGEAGTT